MSSSHIVCKIESAHLTSTSKDKGKKRKKDKEGAAVPYQKKQHKEKRVDSCFFYGAVGYKKKQCTNYHAWRAKKGTLLNLVCYEVNLTSVPKHTWWIDSGATTHISVSMQGCLSFQSQMMVKDTSLQAMTRRSKLRQLRHLSYY